jgi:hypothetical protein
MFWNNFFASFQLGLPMNLFQAPPLLGSWGRQYVMPRGSLVLDFVGTMPTGVISHREGVVVELPHIFHPKISSSLTKRSSGNGSFFGVVTLGLGDLILEIVILLFVVWHLG